MRHAMIALAILMIGSCRQQDGAQVKSFIGLEAGQDGKQSNNAQVFTALSDWFQLFKLKSGMAKGGYETSASKLRSSLPAKHRDWLIRYLKSQEERVDAFVAALDKQDLTGARNLLDLETREMADIALVMIHPDYQPATADLLARFMAASRRSSRFVDKFAATGFLDRLLATADVPTLVASVEGQRQRYRDDLVGRYLADDAAVRRFRQQLAKSRGSLASMRRALTTAPTASDGVSGLALAGSDDDDGGGLAAVFASLLDAGNQQSASSSGSSLGSTSTGGSGDATAGINVPASQSLGSVYASGVSSAPSSSVGAGADSLFSSESPSSVETSAETSAETSFADSQSTAAAVSGSGNADAQDFVDGDTLNSFEPGESFFLAAPTQMPLKPVKAPTVDCNALGLKGYQLVQCHRFAGFANLQIPKTAPTKPKSRFNLLGAGCPNVALLANKVRAGDAESGQGHIFHQGSVGSCSLQAAVGAAAIQVMANGQEPSEVLPMTGSEINQVFESEQGSTPMLNAAIETLRSRLSGKYTVNETVLSDWDDMLACIASGKPALIGLNVDISSWTAGGGGLEFGGGGGGGGGGGATTRLTCGSSGHAIVGVGCDAEGNVIIKNSWGADWNADGRGTGLVDRASCESSAFQGYCLELRKQ